MDAVISRKTGYSVHSGSSHGGAAAGASSRVWFGGSYVEHWSEDYRLLISYRDRQMVEAVFDGERWQPAGGDADMCEQTMPMTP